MALLCGKHNHRYGNIDLYFMSVRGAYLGHEPIPCNFTELHHLEGLGTF